MIYLPRALKRQEAIDRGGSHDRCVPGASGFVDAV